MNLKQGKKFQLLAVIAMLAFVLTGCGGQNNSASGQSSSQKTTANKQQKNSKSNSSDNAPTTLWNTTRDKKLKEFIDQWAPTMHQTYTKYDGVHPLKIATGVSYPKNLSKVNVDGSKASIGWSENGHGDHDYNFVAIYNYDGAQSPDHITYFFAFHNDQPVALVDQSTEGTPNLTETKNNDINTNFEEIASGKSATYSGSQTSSNSESNSGSNSKSDSHSSSSKKSNSDDLVTDPRTVGILLGMKVSDGVDYSQEEDMLGVYKYNGRYWMGTGTSASSIGYNFSGDSVTYYKKDLSGGRSEAEATYDPVKYSLRDLQNANYSTTAQKQYVDDIVNNMGPVSEE